MDRLRRFVEAQGVTDPSRDIDWYFDVISPYAWLQHCWLQQHPLRERVRPRPVLLAGLLDHFGQLGPAEIPSKRGHTYRHVLWLAARHGYPLRIPAEHPFNPLPLLRFILAADCRPEAIDSAFRYVWVDGQTPGDAAALAGLLDDARMTGDQLQDPAIKHALRAGTDAAIERGVFGVPTLAVADRLFWGFDATRMCLDWLRQPEAFAEWEQGIDQIQVAARRQR